MLVLRRRRARVNLAGSVNIDLKAPTTGDYAGLLIWNATTNPISITGNGTLANYNGALVLAERRRDRRRDVHDRTSA